MRADDGERQLTVSGDTHYSPLFFPSHTFSLLHSNRLTNVPWKFTLDAGSGGSRRKVAAAEKRLKCDVEAVFFIYIYIYISRVVVVVVVDNLLM